MSNEISSGRRLVDGLAAIIFGAAMGYVMGTELFPKKESKQILIFASDVSAIPEDGMTIQLRLDRPKPRPAAGAKQKKGSQ